MLVVVEKEGKSDERMTLIDGFIPMLISIVSYLQYLEVEHYMFLVIGLCSYFLMGYCFMNEKVTSE